MTRFVFFSIVLLLFSCKQETTLSGVWHGNLQEFGFIDPVELHFYTDSFQVRIMPSQSVFITNEYRAETRNTFSGTFWEMPIQIHVSDTQMVITAKEKDSGEMIQATLFPGRMTDYQRHYLEMLKVKITLPYSSEATPIPLEDEKYLFWVLHTGWKKNRPSEIGTQVNDGFIEPHNIRDYLEIECGDWRNRHRDIAALFIDENAPMSYVNKLFDEIRDGGNPGLLLATRSKKINDLSFGLRYGLRPSVFYDLQEEYSSRRKEGILPPPPPPYFVSTKAILKYTRRMLIEIKSDSTFINNKFEAVEAIYAKMKSFIKADTSKPPLFLFHFDSATTYNTFIKVSDSRERAYRESRETYTQEHFGIKYDKFENDSLTRLVKKALPINILDLHEIEHIYLKEYAPMLWP